MFEAKTEVVQLESRLGRVGSIQAWDPWESRESVEHVMWWVAKIAGISFGNDEPLREPADIFRGILTKKHFAVLEHVPACIVGPTGPAMPAQSLRSHIRQVGLRDAFDLRWALNWVSAQHVVAGREAIPASTFLVECPLYIRSQWHRHRSQAYNEMSRRWTKGSKVSYTFYGEEWLNEDGSHADPERIEFWKYCLREYRRRLDRGEPQETARGCIPVEARTRFWASAFDRDWGSYLELRDDGHAQPEIAVFAQWIRNFLELKK